MSIDIMNRFWWRDFTPELEPIQEQCPGSEKNFIWTMIVLADMAGDEGFCWPAVATVAKKARLSERAVQMALKQAVTIGILRKRDRRDSSSQYVFQLDRLPYVERPKRPKERGPLEHFEEQEELFGTGAGDSFGGRGTGAGDSLTGAGDSLTGAGDAPRNVNEPSENRNLTDDELCSIVVSAWDHLKSSFPNLAGFGALTDQRKRAIVLRTEEHAGARADDERKLELWHGAFTTIASSKLLLGEATDWQIDSDWMLTKRNFRKIAEKKYGNGRDRRGTAGRNDRSAVEAGQSALELVRARRRGSAGADQPAV